MRTPNESIQSGLERPHGCDLVVTETCMFRCRMCRMWESTANPAAPSNDDWKGFIDSFSGMCRKESQVQFVGGEPLLRDGILDLVSFAASRGLRTTMTTNGWLIDEKMAEAIGESGLSTLVFSMESLDDAVHDDLRGVPGALERVMNAIALTSELPKGPGIHVCTTIMKPNLSSIVALAEWVQKEPRIDSINFQAVMQPFRTDVDDHWQEKAEYSGLWPDDSRMVNDVMLKLALLKGRGAKISNPAAQFPIFVRYFLHPWEFVRSSRCNLGFGTVSVNPVGDIFLCQALPSLGNIKAHTPLKELWESEKAAQVRRQIDSCRNNCKSLINCFFEEEG
jgi:MoaA/NifB/PqqE/SkfB family radical SAM enzyme